MRRLKRLLALILTGFIMFAPPGTLLLGAALIATLFGRTGLVLAVVLCVLGLIFWLRKRRRAAGTD